MALKRRRNDKMWKEFFNFYMTVIMTGLLYSVLFATSEPVCYKRISLDEHNRYMKRVDCDGTDTEEICHRFASSKDVKLSALLDSPCGYPEDYPFTHEMDNTAITCREVDLPTVTDGFFNCSGFSVGDKCNLTCDNGYYPSAKLYIECGEYDDVKGTWTDGIFQCSAITCLTNILPNVEKGSFDCDPSTTISKGEACNLTCNNGFYPAFSRQAVCEAGETHQEGMWSNGSFACRLAITCSTNILPNVEEGSFDCDPNTNISKGEACTLTCNNGFYPAYPSEVVCEEGENNQEGVWSDGKFLCQRFECSEWNEWNGSEYKLTSTEQTWEASRQICMNHTSRLVTIENKEKNEFVHKMMWDCNQNYQSAWIALNDRASEGTWEWSDGTVSTYTNWREGEPNGGIHANCVYIYGDNGKWYDWGCDRDLPAVCERNNSLTWVDNKIVLTKFSYNSG